MKAIECSSCNKRIHLTTWQGLVGGPVKCSSCGVYVNQHDGQPYFQKTGTSTPPSAGMPSASRHPAQSVGGSGQRREFLSSLPSIYYILATLTFLFATFTGIMMLGQGYSGDDWYIFGWLLGSALSIVSIGRVIDLLQKSHTAINKLIEIEKFKLKRDSSKPPVP